MGICGFYFSFLYSLCMVWKLTEHWLGVFAAHATYNRLAVHSTCLYAEAERKP